MTSIINEALCYLAENTFDPCQRHILRADIMRLPDDELLISAVRESKWYIELSSEQRENGSWGRFHTQNTKDASARKFVTTEAALRRARDLGLNKHDPMVKRAIKLMERYLKGEESPPDCIEKHADGGKSFTRAFGFMIAANISLFDPENPILDDKREACARALEKAFARGEFDENAWENENKRYEGPCLRAWMVYPLWLMQNTNAISPALQRKYLNYIWNRSEGIYYISGFAASSLICLEDKRFAVWLSALEALRGFSLFGEFLSDKARAHLSNEVERLMTGAPVMPPAHTYMGRYAQNRRAKSARRDDMLIRVLRILS